jgi:hypothetical protein
LNSTEAVYSDSDQVLAPDPATSRRLFQFGTAALFAGIALLVYRSELENPILIGLGVLAMVLGALPGLLWARNSRAHFPVFEMFMLTNIPFYAVPLLGGHPSILPFSQAATFQAAVALIIFQLCAVTTFTATKGAEIRAPSLTISLLPQAALRNAQVGVWINTIYLYIAAFTEIIPREHATIVRAIFFGVGTVSLFIEMRRWGAGRLVQTSKFAVSLNLLVQVIILFRDLYLIVGISVLLLALIGYVSTSRRIPLLALAIVLPIIAILHTGKSAMRNEYWAQQRRNVMVNELPGFFERWFEAGLNPVVKEEEVSNSLAGRLFERASLFQMLCLVSQNTPENRPFLLGESYIYVPAQLVPRLLWPDKPSSLLSNILLALHYRLVATDDPTSVSIAFGMVSEAYANFGLLGCALLGVVLGYGYKRVSLAAVGRPQFSALGLLTILLAAWSFQVEQIFATWLVSLIQGAAVIIGGPMIFRILFRAD